ncbi:nickel-responsive transcriptional regulator NikR [uncultured Sunxiuqinia sp.]|uniref:nickel-responsive transcriptional regulator NikR n=1 Tax=uncultured Sunxiuqinia sp. TaxID=1573825 RepID=UPI002AA693E9|nr:nickel-responsive transcriptional regulator NikR [uncultured Sunxiuqinia sp.]
MTVSRFGVSLEKDLLDALDQYVKENQFANRSQAIRQLISRNIVEKKWQCNNYVAGSVTLVYDPNRREILNQLADVLENYHQEILSTQRLILDKSKHMEIVAIKGVASRLTELADKLITIKGMQHGKLTMSRAD